MLKKVLLISIIFFSFSFSVFAESIKNYEVNIELQKDSSMLVEERIIYDFGNKQKHGIFRFIPNSFQIKGQEKWGGLKERKLKFSNLKVYQDGSSANIAELNEDDSNNNYFIKIGEKNKVISGIHEYVIKYKVDGSLRYFNDHDEIYWNAIGLDWPVSIEDIKVVVHSDNIDFLDKSCYQGKLGSKKTCSINGNVFSASKLNPKEGLSVSLSFEKGKVEVNEIWGLSGKGFFAIIFGILISVVGGVIIFVRRYLNKYKSDRPVIPIYKPYKNYHPALTGYLIDRKLDSRDLTAGILSLAQKGIMTIEKVEEKGFIFGTNTDYIFSLKKNIEEVNDKLDKFFIKLIFTKDHFVDFLKGVTSITSFVETVIDNTKKEKGLVEEVRLSDMQGRAQDILEKKEDIESWMDRYSVDEKYVEERKNFSNIIIIVVLSTIGLIILGIIFSIDIILPAMFVLIFAGTFLLALISKRYTKKGWEAKNNLDGFKMFLEYTEKERIKFFNSPETNPQEFLDYLPYATAFGVEKEWKNQFKNITIPKPDWYVGPGPFIASSMMSDISSISESITSTMATSSSGAGGGGFSGGGVGGGGGGSW